MKWIFRLITLIGMVVLLAVGALFLIPADRIAHVAAQQIKAQTGRDVTVSGKVSMTLWPVLGVSADGIEVGNADWARQGPMLSAKNAAIGVDALALLSGEIKITNIEAANPTIRLESRLDGRASWEFTDSTGEASIETETDPTREAQAFSIQKLTVTNATLIYDAEGSDLVSYQDVDLSLDWPERLGAAELKAVLRPAGAPVNVSARIEAFSGFVTGQVQPLVAEISTAGGGVSLNGRASTAGDVAGAFGVTLSDTDGFLKALGLGGADLPQGLGRSIKMTTDMTLTSDRRLALRDLAVDLGGNSLTGAADISLNGTPQVNAQLNAGALDLRGLTEGADSSGGASNGGAVETGWSKAAIDASGLASFNGEIGLRATSVDLGTFKLGKTRAVITNERSRMVFDLREVQAYDGTVSGEFVMNNRSGLSVGGKIFAQSIGMQGLLRDALGVERFTGAGDGEVSFLASGGSVHSLMNSMSGKGAINFGKGTIEGLDLDALMRSGQGSGGTTVYDSLGATFSMKGGVLSNSDLLFTLPNYEARGKGVVGLGEQTIEYLFTPSALRANSGKGIAIPVRVTGPWASPSIKPDLQAAIDLNLADKKEELKTKAIEKVQEKLGVTISEGQSLEDAAKNKVENELKKGLLKLFD